MDGEGLETAGKRKKKNQRAGSAKAVGSGDGKGGMAGGAFTIDRTPMGHLYPESVRQNTYLLGTGWRIYRKDHVWYWYNSQSRKGDYNDDLRYPYSDGDVINADGSLSLKEHPVVFHKGRRRRPA